MSVQRRIKAQVIMYPHTTLYAFVFCSPAVKLAVALIFFFLVLQPATPVFAAFEEAETSLSPDVQTTQVTDVILDNPAVEVPAASEEATAIATAEGPTAEELDSTLPLEVAVNQDVMGDVVFTDIVSTSSNGVVPEIDGGDTLASTSTTNVEVVDEALSENNDEDVATTTPDSIATSSVPSDTDAEVEVTAWSSTTTGAWATTAAVQDVVSEHNSSAYQFDTKECVSVGDGAFYCSSTERAAKMEHDGVFAAPDSDGDLEIHVRVDGESTILTSNNVDDAAPYYDALSERIVWHRLIQDRYQIISYDTKTDTESVLTHTSYNNMEPVASGDITLWQAWVDNNWEIMIHDGTKILQLTNNTMQDVSPHMREGYIVWQTQFNDGWQVAVYNQELKTIEYIASESGLKVENPRFVLVYDSTDSNGDTQTLGYDLDSKTSFNLGRLPAQLPDQLPEPDQTGETRALIQNKQTSREGESEVVDVHQGTTTASSTSDNALTLDLSQGQMVAASSSIPITITDVIIPSYTSSSTVNQVIEPQNDVVIPPYATSTFVEVS